MRNLILALMTTVMTFFCFTMNAEESDYHPMLKDGNYWIYVRYMPMCDYEMCLMRIEVCGDTIVNGQNVKRMKGTQAYLNGKVLENYFTAYENNRAVYHGIPGDSEKIMDFNYNLGDKTERGYEVINVDYTYDNHKRLTFIKDGIKHYWVEGIGSDTDQLWDILNGEMPTTIMYGVFLVYKSRQGEYFDKDMFSQEGKKEVGINPVKSDIDDDKIYNLDGIEIKMPQEGEIVIRNGKKFINK